MTPTNLNPLFIDQIRNFAHLITPEAKTKAEFIKTVQQTYSTMQHAMKCGYNSFLYCRSTGTVHMHKLPDIKAGLILLNNHNHPQTVMQTTIF